MFVRRHDAVAPGSTTMNPRCKSAAEALAESPLAGLIDQARLLGRISSVVAEVSREAVSGTRSLPPMRFALQGRTVVITVGTPSQAAKLRQRMAALHHALRERVPEVTGIRIRLQPGEPGEPISGIPPPSAARQPAPREQSRENLSAALRFADDLSQNLHDSPLRRSAARLQASLRAKLDSDR
jgi:hypothetical protein